MKILVASLILLLLVACSQDERGALVHSNKEERHSVSDETLKTEREALKQLGADVSKPVDPKEIMKRVRQAHIEKEDK